MEKKTKRKPPLPRASSRGEAEMRKLESEVLGGMAADPAFHCGGVVARNANASLGHWKTITAVNVADHLETLIEKVRNDDLSDLEGMLVAQAVALQSMFASLAGQATAQKSRENRESLTNLALKAAAQNRATITALADLKFPRSTIFAKQANVAHGPQQVNNGQPAPVRAREESAAAPNEVFALDNTTNGTTTLDARAAGSTGGTDPQLEPVDVIHGAENARGKGRERTQR